jgi:hypothetical protein
MQTGQSTGYIPKDAKWYVAELVQELTVVDDPRNMIWRNLTLVRADSPDLAYERPLSLGREGDTEYFNRKLVRIHFRRISSLSVIHGELEDGAELAFESQVDVSQQHIAGLPHSKEDLSVFRPQSPLVGPDTAAAEVLDEIERRYGVRISRNSENPRG